MTPFGLNFDIPIFLYLLIPALLLFLLVNRGVFKKHLLCITLRCVAIAALLILLAMPYTIREEDVTKESTSILIIDDRTDSMSVYDPSLATSIMESIDSKVGDLSNVEITNITEKDRTALGDAMYQGILGSAMRNNALVLITDGQNNAGSDPIDVAAFAGGARTKIFAVAPDVTGNEVFVKRIEGADKSPVNSRYSGSVVIGAVGNPASYLLRVSVDGENVIDLEFTQDALEKELPFEKIFNSEGPHNITASITPASGDIFPENNRMMKVVNVIERPGILLISNKDNSPLQQVLEEGYTVEKQSRLPAVLDYYSAIVLDDQQAPATGETKLLRDFLNDGGGLVVIGGNSSYENGGYYESSLENLLPVKSREAPKMEGQEVNVVVVLDISGSTGNLMSDATKIDIEKAIAVSIIRDLAEKNNIGVIAFNTESYIIDSLTKLSGTSQLEEKISRLKFGGGTYVVTGLMRAHDMLDGAQGSKYVILISDGITNYPVQAFEEARDMYLDSITLHAVGVGFDTDASFMQGLSTQGGGIYFAPSETERVKIMVGEPEEDNADGENGYAISVTDTHHFITDGLHISNVSVESFNEVTAKSSAQVLAATKGLKPVLTVWRFGLGRVASLSTDDGLGWANELYMAGSSKLISSTVNWAIGDPERDKPLRIGCVSTSIGEETSVVVTSDDDYPPVIMDGKPVSLNRISETSYYFTFVPDETGFIPIAARGYSCQVTVNYPEEYMDFGTDRGLLASIADSTGGEVFGPSEIDQLAEQVSNYTISESTGVEIKKTHAYEWFALMALCIFLADIIIRRVREILHGGAGSENPAISEKPAKRTHRHSRGGEKHEKPETGKNAERGKDNNKE